MLQKGMEVNGVPPTNGGNDKVPVTLLTGFLGAGKTARLNATLKEGKSRIAVIENEIGALGVDGALVANAHSEADDGVIELPNGCLCCSAEVDLVGALEALIHRHQQRPLDRIIIETTGLADIGPVISLLDDKTDPMAEDLYLDGTVTVVDLCSFRQWAGSEDSPIQSWSSGFGTSSEAAAPTFGPGRPGRLSALRSFWRQVAFADQLILSKADQLQATGPTQAGDPIKILQAVNPVAEIIREEEIRPLPLPRGRQTPMVLERLGALPDAFQKPQAAHLEGVACTTLRLPGMLFREDALLTWARGLLAQAEVEVWRIKGLLQVEGRGSMLLQCAGDQVLLEPWPVAGKVPFIVCIGEKGRLTKEDLEASLASCATATPTLTAHG